MAKIPVEKKSGGSIWPWIIGLLLLAGLIWLLFELLGNDDDVDLAEEDTVEMIEDDDRATAGVITSMATLTSMQDKSALIGREVDLSNLRVESVVGDSSFFAVPSEGGNQRLLVVLQGLGETGDPANAPVGADGEYNVDVGDMVDVEGTIEQFTDEVGQQSGVTGADAERALSDGIYLNANELEVMEDAS